MIGGSSMPLEVSVEMTHAAVQVAAADVGIDVLHIKGPSLHPSLSRRDARGETTHLSVDADVWVRPRDVDRLVAALGRAGWATKVRFEDGSAFEHASTLVHHYLGHLDLHRWFPGITVPPEEAFEALWAERDVTTLGGQPCPVPSVTGQRLVLLLHSVRGPGSSVDVQRAWHDASPDDQRAVEALSVKLRAQIALAASLGDLSDDSSPESELWRVLTMRDRSLLDLWVARVRAAPTRRESLRVAIRQLVPNPRRLELVLGRPPTAKDLALAYGRRLRLGLQEVWSKLRGAKGRR
ncbi:MAG: nucleotidyltransferase family protein [Micropruina sp.]